MGATFSFIQPTRAPPGTLAKKATLEKNDVQRNKVKVIIFDRIIFPVLWYRAG